MEIFRLVIAIPYYCSAMAFGTNNEKILYENIKKCSVIPRFCIDEEQR